MTLQTIGIAAAAAACILLLFAGAVKRKAEWLLNVFLRGILGIIAIYFVNGALESAGIAPLVGINPITVLTSGILGFPGIIAIYGIGFYNSL